MRRRDRMRRLVRPRPRFHAVLWLIGLAILALTGRWWPGILVLVAISILLETVLNRNTTQTFEVPPSPSGEEPKVYTPSAMPVETTSPEPRIPSAEIHRADLLPQSCPKCGAPTRASEVRWTGSASADCPYCGTNLPLRDRR